MRDPREEAERLVATVFATVSMAANGATGFATHAAECCACPVCKAIAAARDPDPEFAERVATGAGDLAVGVAGFLRNFGERMTPPSPNWQKATRETAPPDSNVAED